MNETCCFCDFRGTERAVSAHIPKRHPRLVVPNAAGRSQGSPCHLCGYVHDPIDRTGWALKRKSYARGKVARLHGEMDSRKGMVSLGNVKVPKNVSHLTRVAVTWEPCGGPYVGQPDSDGRRYCKKDGRFHHLVPRPGERIYLALRGPGMTNGETVVPLLFGDGGAYRVEPPIELRSDPALRDKLRLMGQRTPPP